MLWTKKTISIALLLLMLVPVAAQQQVKIDEIRFEKYDRFVRFDIAVSNKPVFSFEDDLRHGVLQVHLDAEIPQNLPMPQAAPGAIAVLQSGKKTVLQIRYPNKFRYNSFFYAPENKIIIDIYPGKEPAAVKTPVKNTVVAIGSTYANALTALQSGDTTKAIALFKKAIEKNPGHDRAYLQLGILHALRNDKEAAIASLQRARKNVEFSFISNLYLQKLTDSETAVVNAQTISSKLNQKVLKKDEPGIENQKETGSAGENAAAGPLKKAGSYLSGRVLTYAGIVIALTVLIYLWRLLFGSKPGRKTGKDDQVQRILSLMEKNDLYRSAKSQTPSSPMEEVDDEAEPAAERLSRLNLQDEAVPAAPRTALPQEKIQLAEGYPPAERRIESSRLRQIQRTMNENNVVPESRNRLTATALKVKSQVLDYALDGYSVREIAEKLQVGVGEVELILGLKKAPKTKKGDDKSALRIDFSY